MRIFLKVDFPINFVASHYLLLCLSSPNFPSGCAVFFLRKQLLKGVRALRGYFGPPMRSKKSDSSQVSSY